ncbi:flagellar basal body P-ring protein FlgI [Hirschia baltica]|uniref:Flagellar P-ring protein n=1 Tax=Hirschia baltica (strain ATCC 49814 / DSM 5838 / IFAM 1418) TaxID=582402 RepID=C6XN56_HIRBI|nr:flagellar basal body P-ring protein FlgI [Hirschia baltica]ACT58226.1 flagellar P-ring protein [Hirschia baltica ATCC 49814]
MNRILCAFFLTLLLSLNSLGAAAGSRLKDIVDIEGVRDNQLIGYGIVVGLNGSGDSLRNSPMTRQSLEAMLERLGVNTREETLNTKNVAAVMVTASLPAFSTAGSRIDITVSAMGDAKSLEGGTLLVTPLMGANGEVYAVGQGSVAVGGFAAGGDSGSALVRNVPTNGRIPNGALVELEVPYALNNQNKLRLSLRNPDFTTATRISSVINSYMGTTVAFAMDPATVALNRPPNFQGGMSMLLAEIERLEVEPDQPARIVINETTGIIVMGENVRVSQVAIAQGNLTISVSEQPAVSQPNAFGAGETVVVPQTDIAANEDVADLALIGGSVPLNDLVNGLNALGVSPRDMISILQALKASGALQADIEIM